MNEMTSTSSLVSKLRHGARPINVFSHPAFSSFLLQSAPHDWREKARDKMDELVKLPVGWDGYFAPPVSFSVAHFAMNALALFCPIGAPEPQIVPGPNGDLQVEWHTEDSDIEWHFRRPNDVVAWRQTPATPDDGEEIHVTTDFRVVGKWLEEISEDAVAAHSSAA